MADLTDIVTLITILKNVLISGVQADRDTREKIASMTDEEVIAFARTLIADTEQKAEDFLARLDAENPE